MVFKIDLRSSIPVYKQLVQETKRAILKNLLQPGDRLPSVRELAVQLTINPNTVQKAYHELERQGAIENLQGKGTFVAMNYQPNRDNEKVAALREDLCRTLVEARYLGFKKQEVVCMVEQLLDELDGR